MKNLLKKTTFLTVGVISILAIAAPILALASDEEAVFTPHCYASLWSLLPPVVAIILALITKEVYSSLFLGILMGGLLYSSGNFEMTVNHVFSDGFVAVLADPYNMGIIIFLVLLGTMVALMNSAGGSAAFGRWAKVHIKTRVGAQLATILLGVLIFIDDYFNCLTVGSVMRPVTDGHHISRAKLAYLIDATAAPVCIIAPISSWAAAVSGFVEGENGLALFMKAIPYNYYAILTIVMMVGMVLMKVEFGPMARFEQNALKGDLFSEEKNPFRGADEGEVNPDGRVSDLVIPIVCLIVCCVIGMIWSGGFFAADGENYLNFVTAFSSSDASVGLAVGSFFGLVITIIMYLFRRVLTFSKCMECLVDGFKAMVPAILILSMAWTLKAMTDSLGAKEFVAALMKNSGRLESFLPALIFLVACFLAFSTGTSWGTFGILIPIVVEAFQASSYSLMIVSISACMAGAVCGDHCSPISDTTIMASAGAQCDHVNHVTTQLPYAIVAAGVSFVAFLIAGFVRNAFICLPIAILLMVLVLMLIRFVGKSSEEPVA